MSPTSIFQSGDATAKIQIIYHCYLTFIVVIERYNVTAIFIHRSGESRCLNNMPTISGPTQSPLLQARLPGEIFDGDKQCEMAFWSGIKQCSAKKVYF